MANIDLKDRKLLVALSQHSRASQAQLGRSVGISKSAVAYRIKRLREAGIIRRFLTVINLSAIGYTTYNVFFRLHADKDREAGIFAYFDQHPNAIWSCRFLGMWDFHVELVARDFAHFNTILQEILHELGDTLEDYRTHVALQIYKVEHLPKHFVEHACVDPLELPDRRFKDAVSLQAIDRKILFALNNDATAPLHAIAADCDVSLDVVHYRMKKMYKEGIILAYIPFVALHNLGYTEYFCQIELRHLTQEKADMLKEYLVSHKHIKYAFRGASRLEVLFLLAVENVAQLDTLFSELKHHFFSEILDIHAHLITEQGNFTLFPKGLVE